MGVYRRYSNEQVEMLVKSYSDSQFEHKRTKIWLAWAVQLLEEMAETVEDVPSDYHVLLEYAKENLGEGE